MPDDWKTPSPPRLIGHLNDAHGHSVAISVDRGDVLIRRGGQDIRLGADELELFMQLFCQALSQVEHPEGPVS